MFAQLRPLQQEILQGHLDAGRSPLLSRLLAARCVGEAELLRLTPVGASPDPRDVPGLGEITEDVLAFLRAGGRLAVHGDYDVDGVSASAIAAGALGLMGHAVEVFLPHRLQDGYGLHPETVRRLRDGGIEGILTVDCGVSGHAAAKMAKELGVRLWVTDHHILPRTPLDAPLAHPGRLPEDHPLRPLCGAGLAYQCARAWVGDERAVQFLDLAALGTLADQVPLLGENRRIVQAGLDRMRRDPRPGLHALLEEAASGAEVDEETVAFRIAPRLNACGRMDTPRTAYRLLTADAAAAPALAREAARLNRDRQEVETRVLAQARAAARIDGAVVAFGEGWHRGVIGIVASRLAEEFSLPAFVISCEGEEAHGSARAPEGLPLLEALDGAGDILTSYGGHRGAAGFRLPSGAVAELSDRLAAHFRRSRVRPVAPTADVRLTLREVQLDNVAALATLRPYGQGNPQPLFLIEDAEVLDAQPIGGGKHARLRLRDGAGTAQAIHWRAAPTHERQADLLVALEENAFRGERSARLRVVAVAPSAGAQLLASALWPPAANLDAPAPQAVIDRRGRGAPPEKGLVHYFTLDATTAREACAALGAGFYAAAPGQEAALGELHAGGRLEGVVGPHPSGLPITHVVALEHPADPRELQAVAMGAPISVCWRREDEPRVLARKAVWTPSDAELREAYRRLRLRPEGSLSLPPVEADLAVAWAIFRDLGLIEDGRLVDRRVDIAASRLRVALAARAARYQEYGALWTGPLRELEVRLRAPARVAR